MKKETVKLLKKISRKTYKLPSGTVIQPKKRKLLEKALRKETEES